MADHDHEESVLADVKDVPLTVHFRGTPYTLRVPEDWTLSAFADLIAETYSIPADKQKYMITPKGGTFKHPFPSELHVSEIKDKKVVLLGTPTQEIANLEAQVQEAQKQAERRRAARHAHQSSSGSGGSATTVSRRRNWKEASEEAAYTFHSIRPLAYLPNPDRSKRFLERLANDPGIKASMRKHKFSVGLLTEMNPAEHTTHESRTLGLNRNRGEVIELRLRTDAYDGYRDYRTIRKTLCHELSHNVWGEHDRNFWDLTKQIEKEVERNDWQHAGHSLGSEEFYNPNDQGIGDSDVFVDHGGWTGGTYVLGSSGGSAASGAPPGLSSSSSSALSPATSALAGSHRRDAMARAAEERARQARDAEEARRRKREDEGGSEGTS